MKKHFPEYWANRYNLDELKPVFAGDKITIGKEKDRRVFEAINQNIMKIYEYSENQINNSSIIRSGKSNPFSSIEPLWYVVRGYVFCEKEVNDKNTN